MDNMLEGYELAMEEANLEDHSIPKFIELDLKTKQTFGFKETNVEKEIGGLMSAYQVDKDTVLAVANLESGKFTKILDGIKKFFTGVFGYIKRAIFFWKKQDIKKSLNKCTPEAIIEKVKKRPKTQIELYLLNKMGVRFDDALSDMLLSLLQGKLKTPLKDTADLSWATKTEDFKQAIKRYIPDEKRMILFKKKLEVSYELALLMIDVTNITEKDNALSGTAKLSLIAVIRDTKDNIVSLAPIEYNLDIEVSKENVIKGVEEYVKKHPAIVKDILSDMENSMNAMAKVEKALAKLEKEEEDSALWKALHEIGYNVDVKDMVSMIGSTIKILFKKVKGDNRIMANMVHK